MSQIVQINHPIKYGHVTCTIQKCKIFKFKFIGEVKNPQIRLYNLSMPSLMMNIEKIGFNSKNSRQLPTSSLSTKTKKVANFMQGRLLHVYYNIYHYFNI